ncbi:MAG: aminoglycoside phosphotransferase family protein [Anaerolineales bacterium]|nr:aminoglycoside phosphotransferase family protein [Anaerolineales bacterium]
MNNPQLPWHDPTWIEQAHAWIRSETARRSIQLTGEIEQPHAYSWSTVLHVPTSAGKLYFKATAPETLHEIALTEKLAGWFPDCQLELVAVDTARGWMLMRDGGEQLRASIRPTKDVRPWEPVIVKYAELQIGLAEHVEEILALGIPDHRLAVLPPLYQQLLREEESLMIGQEKGLTAEEFDKLQKLTPRFEQICMDLAAYGIPESLNHGDFHDGNVLLKNGRVTFFDWGDADVTHPFVSLRTFFVSMEIALGLDDYVPPTPEMTALLHRYLEQWQGFASKEDLLKAYALSRPVASIVKTLSWHTTISRMNTDLRKEYAWIVPEVLREFMVYEGMLSQ